MADGAVGCRPPLDARERPLDPRTVERNLIRGAIDGVGRALPCTGRIKDRYEVFGTREDKEFRLLVIPVPRQPLSVFRVRESEALQPKRNGPFSEPES
jgi:hypothetical protein